jgi:hypothetical protein
MWCDFHFICSFQSFTPLLSHLPCCDLRDSAFLLTWVMEGEHSPMIEGVVGDEMEVSRPKEMMPSSSSGDASNDKSGDGTDTLGEHSEIVDPRESS